MSLEQTNTKQYGKSVVCIETMMTFDRIQSHTWDAYPLHQTSPITCGKGVGQDIY